MIINQLKCSLSYKYNVQLIEWQICVLNVTQIYHSSANCMIRIGYSIQWLAICVLQICVYILSFDTFTRFVLIEFDVMVSIDDSVHLVVQFMNQTSNHLNFLSLCVCNTKFVQILQYRLYTVERLKYVFCTNMIHLNEIW